MLSKSVSLRSQVFKRYYSNASTISSNCNHRKMHKLVQPSDNVPKKVTPLEAVQCIQSNNRVFVHSVAAAPRLLIEAMISRHDELRNVEVCHIHTEQTADYINYPASFKNNNFFCGNNVRKAVGERRVGFVPIFLSEVPNLFKRNILPLDVAMLQVSPPDAHGYCSLGPSVDISVAAAESSKYVIAQVNPNHPRTHGDGLIHISCLDAIVDCNDPLPTIKMVPPDDVETAIGKNIANLIEDGSTLQMGIGSIPNAVLEELKHGFKDLGIHSEMMADGVIDLINSGVVNNSKKIFKQHITTVGFVYGTQRVYDFLNDNPSIHFYRIESINDPAIIRLNPKVVAINSAIEVDLTGQVCADSIGTRIYSGVGGQIDFMRGSALSEGGKPIIALPSVTAKGISRIAPILNNGAGVVTTRAHVHYIVTEYGVANLYGANLHQRANRLIKIAHPDHREALEKAAYNEYNKYWWE